MKLYITRHGETEENVNGIIQGHNPGKLTIRGIEQAKRLALRLRDEHFDAIYSSDLQRAVDTARYISQFHSTPIVYTPEIRERNLGILHGRPLEELRHAEEHSRVPIIDYTPKGGESFRDLHNRAARFLKELHVKYTQETILLISHGGWNRMLLGIVMGKNIEESLGIIQANTCVNIVEYDQLSKYKVHLLNSLR